MQQYIGDTLSPKEILKRFRISVFIIVVAALVLTGRLYYLQIYSGHFYSLKSQSNFVQFRLTPAPRGIIFDRNNEILAESRPSFEVYITPAFCSNPAATLEKLDNYLDLTLEEYQAAQSLIKKARGLTRFRPQLVKSDINREALGRILFYINELEGVNIFPVPHRSYPHKLLAAQLIGYVNEIGKKELEKKQASGLPYKLGDYIGRGGIEQAYEKWLHSEDGELKTVVDARGMPVDESVSKILMENPVIKDAKAGMDIYLTLDEALQQEAEKALDDFGAVAGAMVVMNPQNGDILAYVSRPTVDPNELSGRLTPDLWKRLQTDPLKPLLDRVIQATYPPGSTFKPVTALAALASGKISENETVYCPGYFNFGGVRFRCWNDRGHGPMNMITGIRSSCDVYFYTLASRTGTPKMMHFAEELGLGAPLGIELPNERPGVLPTVEWHNKHTPGGFTEGQTINQAIGQGALTLNALQLAVVYSAVANGGTVYKPRFVSKIADPSGNLIKNIPVEILHKAEDIPPEDFELVRKGLTAVMNDPGGTAYWRAKTILPPGIVGAGKTGTAQVVKLKDVRKAKEDVEWHLRDHALFVTFLPAENAEIVVAVIHEHGGHGGSDAAPIALNFAKRYFELTRGTN